MMKIAVTYENGQVFQHFGHTQQFKLYEVENGELVSSRVVDTNGSGHGAGSLQYDPNTVCAHHHNHGEGHNCGAHGHDCGGHRC